MAEITLQGNKINTVGELPKVGEKAPVFKMIKNDLSVFKLNQYKGKRVILNIFPSIDTGVCAKSVREFNKVAGGLENTKVLCISRDLPFAQSRFCGAEGIENVETLSDFDKGKFGKNYGLTIKNGAFKNLFSRAIIVLDDNHKIIHTEQVNEIAEEPNYQKALDALK